MNAEVLLRVIHDQQLQILRLEAALQEAVKGNETDSDSEKQ